jgi:hypothetical protein
LYRCPSVAAATLSNHVNAFNQDTLADLYNGNAASHNEAARNGALAAYCVGTGCAAKVKILDSLIQNFGGGH